MQKLTNWFRNVFTSKDEEWTQMSSSIQKMAAAGGVNRRKTARIYYPNTNYSSRIPMIFYKSHICKPVDLSLGGVCIENSNKEFGTETGKILELEMKWQDGFSAIVKSRIVAQSFNKAHFQFQELPTETYVKLSINLKAGMLGRKFQSSYLTENPQIKTECKEIWIGLNNENLQFFEGLQYDAELNVFGCRIHLKAGEWPHRLEQQSQAIPVDHGLYSDIVILLANIPNPSPNIKSLLNSLETVTFQEKKAI